MSALLISRALSVSRVVVIITSISCHCTGRHGATTTPIITLCVTEGGGAAAGYSAARRKGMRFDSVPIWTLTHASLHDRPHSIELGARALVISESSSRIETVFVCVCVRSVVYLNPKNIETNFAVYRRCNGISKCICDNESSTLSQWKI